LANIKNLAKDALTLHQLIILKKSTNNHKENYLAFINTLNGSKVYVKNDNAEQAIRKFKKKIQDSGLIQDLRAREAYEKPTTKRKRKAAAAKQRWKKQLSKQQLPEKLY
jgi:small subunit ribosomal protein S21